MPSDFSISPPGCYCYALASSNDLCHQCQNELNLLIDERERLAFEEAMEAREAAQEPVCAP